MSTYGAILGASIGVILLCLVVMVACYVLYAVSHMKALDLLRDVNTIFDFFA